MPFRSISTQTSTHIRRLRGRYKEGGPSAAAAFEAGVAGVEARAFRGCGIFTSEPFEVSDGALGP